MKINYVLFLLMCILLFFAACTKNQPVINAKKAIALDTVFTLSPITASIIGKWQVTKERKQTLTTSTGVVTDVTYPGEYFITNNSYMFNSDSTATFASGTTSFTCAFIVVNGASQTIIPMNFLYNVSGSNLTITRKYGVSLPSAGDPGPYHEIIVQLDVNQLVLHSIYRDGSGITVLDVYLMRLNF